MRMVSVINIELIPDVFQLQSCHSTFNVNKNEEKEEVKSSHHRTWCSFHPLNLRRRNKVQILPSNSHNRRSNDVSNTSISNQSVPDKFHQRSQFQNTYSSSKSGAVISSYFRCQLDLSKTKLPDKDIKILNLLVKKLVCDNILFFINQFYFQETKQFC